MSDATNEHPWLVYQFSNHDAARTFITDYPVGALLEDFCTEIREWNAEEISFVLSALRDLCLAVDSFQQVVLVSQVPKLLAEVAFANGPRACRTLALCTLVQIGDGPLMVSVSYRFKELNEEAPLLLGTLILEARTHDKQMFFDFSTFNEWGHPALLMLLTEIGSPIGGIGSGLSLEFNFLSLVIGHLESEFSTGVLPAGIIEKLLPFVRRAYQTRRRDHPFVTCPACGFRSLSRGEGCFEVCSVCKWVDDLPRRAFPSFRYERNDLSLTDKI